MPDESGFKKLQELYHTLKEMNRNLKEVNARTTARRAKYQIMIDGYNETHVEGQS